VALLIAAVLRFIFLARNYTCHQPDRKGITYMMIIAVEALYYFVVSTTFFTAYYIAKATPTVAAAAPTPQKAAHFLRTFLEHGLHQ